MLTKDLILKFYQEADEYLEKDDVIQACEKYYKAAEETIKNLAVKHRLKVLEKVISDGQWSARYLFYAVEELEKIYNGIKDWWKQVWYLHVYGFHEAVLDKNKVAELKDSVKKIISLLS